MWGGNNPKRKAIYRRLIGKARWQKLRLQQLKDHPMCERCLEQGYYTAATEVHHINPVEDAPTEKEMEQRCYSPLNLMSVCHRCHIEIHKELFSRTKETRRNLRDKENKEMSKRLFGFDPT